MPKNVMKLLKRSANHARNDFDLSHRHVFTANFGEILPATQIETVPGDYIEMRASDLLRLIPMVTSPFLRAKQHIDVWWTPYEYLWDGFEPFITQKDNPASASTHLQPKFCPHFTSADMLGAITDANTNSLTDIIGRPLTTGMHKIFDLLGYGYNTEGNTYAYNMFRALQYQKLFYDEYRQQYYDDGVPYYWENYTTLDTPAKRFNVDDLDCRTEAGATFGNNVDAVPRLQSLFELHYRTWKKDLFTGLMPSTQFGNVSTVSISERYLNTFGLSVYPSADTYGRWIGTTGVSSSSIPRVVGTGSTESTGVASDNTNRTRFFAVDSDGNQVPLLGLNRDSSGSFVAPKLSILDLRHSEAIQIWREAALTAGNRISDNLRAHYGDDVEYNDRRSVYLGSVDAPINVADVNATAQVGDGTNQGLGDVAGKGLSSLDEKVFKFKAKKFGCIMVLFSILPEGEYESTGIDRMNQLLEPEDFFVPEYMDLGLEAVSAATFFSNPAADKVLGYAPRYYGYKQKLDKVFNGFHNGDDFSSWVSPRPLGDFMSESEALPLAALYVNPSVYDGNFAVDVENSEQVLCDVYFDVSAVREMSISGLPRL